MFTLEKKSQYKDVTVICGSGDAHTCKSTFMTNTVLQRWYLTGYWTKTIKIKKTKQKTGCSS